MSTSQSELFGNKLWKWKETKKTSYNYKGERNSKHYKMFKKICRLTQSKLKTYLEMRLDAYYDTVYTGDGYIYAKGTNSNVVLTAHMDTVNEPQGRICTDIYEYYDKKNKRHILSSPQGIGGDDRCGIYAILDVLAMTDIRPTIIFCEDEESGGVGSDKFCRTKFIKEVTDNASFMIEIDRANANDAVFYEEDNAEFQKYVMDITGNKEAYGSFSDICNLSEESGVSSFNISCGYYNAHTTDEYVVMEELEACIQKVIKLLKANQEDGKKFKYEPYVYYKNSYGYDYGFGYSYNYGKRYGVSSAYGTNEVAVEFIFYRSDKQESAVVYGDTFEECVGTFLMDNPDLCWGNVYDYHEF